jgi:Transposase DDE domain
LRWRIERDYHELKQEVGLGHFEGRGWRGFHHHATLCIAAYGFLISERETIPPQELVPPGCSKKLSFPKAERRPLLGNRDPSLGPRMWTYRGQNWRLRPHPKKQRRNLLPCWASMDDPMADGHGVPCMVLHTRFQFGASPNQIIPRLAGAVL